ncbi:unnamed protein product [Orchesella dallaii]|uniref:Anoctamin n=1 Tax=Orchesella dallaii TaxID=48710 RepID=A0ABP1QIT9_9HEXA
MSSKKPKQKKRLIRNNIELELNGYETVSSDEDLFSALLGDERDTRVVQGGADNPFLHLLNPPDLSSEYALPDVNLPGGSYEDPFAHTELVLKFSHSIHPSALKWFIERVTAKKSNGGGELLLRREPFTGHKKEGLVVHVTAADWRQLEVAEILEIKKMDFKQEEPAPREFKFKELGRFLSEGMKVSQLLSPAEKQMVVLHELRNVRVKPGEKHVPGYDDTIHILPGDSLQEIRSYFGDDVCLYFNFVAFYNAWLIVPAIFGLIMAFLPSQAFHSTVVYFCFLNMMFVILFLINWQRKCSELAFLWGTLKMNKWEEPRPSYVGELSIDPVTGKFQRSYSSFKTGFKTFFGSGLVTFACIALSMYMLYSYLDLDDWVKEISMKEVSLAKNEHMKFIWEHVIPVLPGVGYAACVFTANKLFRVVANYLTEWENHRTQSQFHRHLVSKMVVFEVFNGFAGLFYAAFVLRDVDVLRKRVYTMLCVIQFLVTLTSCVIPVVIKTGKIKMHEFLQYSRPSGHVDKSGNYLTHPQTIFGGGKRRSSRPYPELEGWLKMVEGMEVMEDSDLRVQMSKLEGFMDSYDYQEDFEYYFLLLLQFGHVFLFSSVYPPAALVAFGANMILLPASLYKLRNIYQRPFAQRVSNIGAWQEAFGAVAVLAVMMNCALLCANTDLREYGSDLTDAQWIFLFVLMEHMILGSQFLVGKIISKIPYNIKVSLAASDYRSWKMLKKEQSAKTRRRFTKLGMPMNEQVDGKSKAEEHDNSSQGSSRKRKAADEKKKLSNSNEKAKPGKIEEKAASADAKSQLSKKKA